MKTLRNLNKAAKALSSFNFDQATTYCVVSFYFSSGDRAAYGSELNYPYEHDDTFKKWGKDEWRKYILEKAEAYVNLKPTMVVSINIVFRLEGNSELYHIEMTDMEEGRFDRIVKHGCYPLREMVLNTNESARIRGVRDIVKTVKEFPGVRTSIVSSDLPKVMVKSRRNQEFDGFRRLIEVAEIVERRGRRNFRLGCR